MNWSHIPLGKILAPAPMRRAGTEEYPILSMTMSDGLVLQSEKFKKRVASRDTANYRVVKNGELVVGFPIDEAVLAVQRVSDAGIVSPAYKIWTIDTELADELYLERYLRSEAAIAYYVSNLRSSTARRRVLPDDKFRGMPIPLPGLEQQKKIVAILDRAETIRRKREHALDLADEFLKSVFLEMFGDPLRPKDGLEVSNIGAECNLYAGNSLPKGEEFRGQEGGILLAKVSDMNSSENTTEIKSAKLWAEDDGKIRQSIIAPSGAIVFPKRGGAISTNKKRVLARKAVLDPNLMGVSPKSTSRISSEYLRAWFGFIDLVTISSGSTVPQLNKKHLDPLPIAVPSPEAMSTYSNLSRKNSELRMRLDMALKQADNAVHALSQRAFRCEL